MSPPPAPASPWLDRLKVHAGNLLARESLRHPRLEHAVAAACKHPVLGRKYVGAIAFAYMRVLNEPELRVADLGAYKLHVDVADELGIGPYFFGDTRTSWVTPAIVGPGDTCVDAGANVGHYTFRLASLVGSKGRVIAFEPNPRLGQMIERSIAINGFEDRVSLVKRALWNRSDETLTFYLSTNTSNSGTSSIINHGVFIDADHTVKVETITLADVAKARDIERFALVKMDIERAEAAAIEGMDRLLFEQRIDALIVEMHAGSDADKLLRAKGYEPLLLDEDAKRLVPDATPGLFGDYLAMAPRARDALVQRIRAVS